MTGLFITVEGPDGAGKSTLVAKLNKKLQSVLTVPFISTREPGGSDLAEKIREVIIDPENKEMDAKTEALLFAASRRQHIIETIQPALNRGEVVLCDRFVDSSIAYQGAGRKIGVEEVATLNQFATENLEPDLTLYLDVDAQVGLNRIGHNNSGRKKDRLELEEVSFHNRVRDTYLILLENNPDRMQLIDASKSPEDVFNEAWMILENELIKQNLLEIT